MTDKLEYHIPDDASLSAEDIILGANNIGFDSLLSIKKVQMPEDTERYNEQGYPFLITEGEFHKTLPVLDTSKIWFTPSLTCPLLYYNPDTLAAACHLEHVFIQGDSAAKKIEGLVQHMEEAVAQKDFRGSIRALPEAARMEYFNLLLEKYSDELQSIPNLFLLFIGNYLTVSYGFDRLHPQTFRAIIGLRLPEQAQAVQAELAPFPDVIQVYRGGSEDISLPPERAYSWSTSIRSALFFAGRLTGSSGYIAVGTVPKDKVIYSDMGSSEREIIVFPEDVSIEDTLHLSSIEELEPTIQKVTARYQLYRSMLPHLDFNMDSDLHGRLHSARVLLLALVIAELMHLPDADRHTLSMAAIFHDSRRDNDGEDQEHGQLSAQYYRESFKDYDPVADLVIKYHCLPDKEGYKAIEKMFALSEEKTRARKLFDIFKDADGLDRVRFGWKSLDLNQLRYAESKTLPLFAMESVHNITL